MPDNAEFYKGLRIKNGPAAGDEKLLLIVSGALKEDHPTSFMPSLVSWEMSFKEIVNGRTDGPPRQTVTVHNSHPRRWSLRFR